jgi:hypothetical protein
MSIQANTAWQRLDRLGNAGILDEQFTASASAGAYIIRELTLIALYPERAGKLTARELAAKLLLSAGIRFEEQA